MWRCGDVEMWRCGDVVVPGRQLRSCRSIGGDEEMMRCGDEEIKSVAVAGVDVCGSVGPGRRL